MNILTLAFALVMVVGTASSQVLIAPTAAYLGDRSTSTTVQIMNPSTEDREVTLRLEFGYPVTDSTGTTTIEYADSHASGNFSCASWITVFPRKFLLKAGARQTVRLTARTPASISDGVYWARLVTTTITTTTLSNADTTTNVGARLAFNYNQVIPVTYRHGDPTLQLSTTGLTTQVYAGKTLPILPLAVTGNGAFIGSITCDATPLGDGTPQRVVIPISVYFNANKRIGEPLSILQPGSYRLALRVAAEKEGTSTDLIARADEVTLESTIVVDNNGNISVQR